jgi:hypothetical protein
VRLPHRFPVIAEAHHPRATHAICFPLIAETHQGEVDRSETAQIRPSNFGLMRPSDIREDQGADADPPC